MIPPVKIKKGLFFKKAVLSKIEEICGYLRQTRMIAGPGIRIRETAAGSVIESLKNENQNSKEGPSQSSEGEAELIYNSAFKAEVLLSSEGGGKKIRIFDPGDPSGQTAGYCDAIGSVDVYEQDFFEDTSFSLFFHIFYSHDLEKYLYEFSENSSVEGESAVSIRIASWNASEKKLIQQWWNGDIMLCYNYIV